MITRPGPSAASCNRSPTTSSASRNGQDGIVIWWPLEIRVRWNSSWDVGMLDRAGLMGEVGFEPTQPWALLLQSSSTLQLRRSPESWASILGLSGSAVDQRKDLAELDSISYSEYFGPPRFTATVPLDRRRRDEPTTPIPHEDEQGINLREVESLRSTCPALVATVRRYPDSPPKSPLSVRPLQVADFTWTLTSRPRLRDQVIVRTVSERYRDGRALSRQPLDRGGLAEVTLLAAIDQALAHRPKHTFASLTGGAQDVPTQSPP